MYQREAQRSKIYRARYSEDRNLLTVNPKPTDSPVWKSLCNVMDIISTGLTEGYRDQLFRWKLSSDGYFSVRSGYHLARLWKLSTTSIGGESSNSQIHTRAWAKLWKLRIPNRIKIFVWKVYYNAPPIFDNLRHRGCDTETKCFQCGFQVESTQHILLSCWWNRSVWNALNISWPEVRTVSSSDWIWNFMVERNTDELRLISIDAWLKWWNKNLLFTERMVGQ